MSHLVLAPPAGRTARPGPAAGTVPPRTAEVAGCRVLGPFGAMPAPLWAHLGEELSGRGLRILLRLPASPASSRGLAERAGAWRREVATGSPRLLEPLAVEAAPGALWVAYPLPDLARPGRRAAAPLEGAASPAALPVPIPSAAPTPLAAAPFADLLAVAGSVACAQPELLCLLVLAGCLAALADLHAQGRAHGLLGPGWLLLAGAAPARLLAECPRDPAVRLFGCGVAAALAPGRRCRPEDDLPLAAAHVRALLATQVSEPAAEAAADSVPARLARLLAALQAPDPGHRPSAARAAAVARELVLRALAEWEERRDRVAARVRYAAPDPRQRAGGGTGRHGVRAGGRADRAPGDGEAPRQLGSVAIAREWSDARADRPGGMPALALGPAEGPVERVGSWVALAPSLLAALLSLLLAVTLLLGL